MDQSFRDNSRFVILGTFGTEIVHTSRGVSGRKASGTGFYSAAALCALGVTPSIVTKVPRNYSFPAAVASADTSMVVYADAHPEFFWEASYDATLSIASTLRLDASIYDCNPGWWASTDLRSQTFTHAYIGAFEPMQQRAFISDLLGDPIILVETIEHWIRVDALGFLKVLADADILVINDRELRMLLSTECDPMNPSEQMLQILVRSNLESIVVTFGERGASLYTRNAFAYLPALPATAQDTTGAGNVFGATLLGFVNDKIDLAQFEALLKAVAAATVMASDRVSTYGAYAPSIRNDDIRARSDGLLRAARIIYH